MGDRANDFDAERRVLRDLLATPSVRLIRLPDELEPQYVAHQRSLARRYIQRFWPVVLLAAAAAVPMAVISGVLRSETFALIGLGFVGLVLPIAAVVVANLTARLERAAPHIACVAAVTGLTMMHALTLWTPNLPDLRSVSEDAVILVTLATFTIANLGFRAALASTVAALGLALALGWATEHSPNWALFPFYAIGSIVVGVITGLTGEIRDRTVFLQERLLDLEKRELDMLSRELAAISRKDSLTGLPNRRHFDEIFEREWSSCVREQAPLGMLFIDVDYFKRFNDLHGHQAGDDCLREVGAALTRQALRGSDFVARYGGEEFIAIFPRTEPAGMSAVAERFMRSVDSLQIPHGDSTVAPHVTVSIGVACLAAGEQIERTELLKRADQALYHAKASGRHCFRSIPRGATPDLPSAREHASLSRGSGR